MEPREPAVLRIADYRRKLQAERPAYLHAQADVQARPMHESILEDLLEIQGLCRRYTAGSDPVGAAYYLAQVTLLLEQLLAPWAVVSAFEATQQRLRSLEDS